MRLDLFHELEPNTSHFRSKFESNRQESPPSIASSSRTRRVRCPDPEEIERIQAMSGPSDMESGERKRQYAALGRAVKKSMNPALIQKMRMCSDGERLLF